MDHPSSPESCSADQQNEIRIGSKHWSLLRQSSLLFSFVAAIGLVYLFYLKLVGDRFSAAATVLLAVFAVIFRRHYVLPAWAEFISRDSAYGAMEPDGITYRAPFRLHHLPWVKIFRVVYLLEDRGRIDIHLFNQHSPIRFGPALSRDVEETQFIHSIEARLKAVRVPLDLRKEPAHAFYNCRGSLYNWRGLPVATRENKSFEQRNTPPNRA